MIEMRRWHVNSRHKYFFSPSSIVFHSRAERVSCCLRMIVLIMAATRNILPRFLAIPRATAPTSTIATSRRALFTSQSQKYYHSSPPFQQDVSAQQPHKPAQNPIAESMKASASPAGNKTTTTTVQGGQEDENRNAAFLGEADSDDGFEAEVDAHPEAHRHQFSDVSASGMHGQSGELLHHPAESQVDAPGH